MIIKLSSDIFNLIRKAHKYAEAGDSTKMTEVLDKVKDITPPTPLEHLALCNTKNPKMYQ